MGYVFVDRVDECEPGERVVAVKALALNEELFRDHFPGMPVLPGTMILEGFVQAARHCLAALPGGHDRWILREVSNMKFNRFAVPGETVRLEVSKDGDDEAAIWFRGEARVSDERVCRARFSVRPRESAID